MLNHTSAYTMTLHGVFLEIFQMGVLLVGPSGIGKSELALVLINHGHRFIADDIVHIRKYPSQELIATADPLLQNLLEVRGLGVLDIKAMYGKNAIKESHSLQLIIEMRTLSQHELATIDRIHGLYQTKTLLEVGIPQVTLPVVTGRNLATLVEAAVRKQQVFHGGYDAGKSFCRRQQTIIQQSHLMHKDVCL